MRAWSQENRPYGSEGGARFYPCSYPYRGIRPMPSVWLRTADLWPSSFGAKGSGQGNWGQGNSRIGVCRLDMLATFVGIVPATVDKRTSQNVQLQSHANGVAGDQRRASPLERPGIVALTHVVRGDAA